MAVNWASYDRWNEALASHLFSPELAELPAYIDVDASVLEKVAADLGIETEAPDQALAEVVRETLGFDDGVVLQDHMRRYQAWRRTFTRANAARSKGQSAELTAPPVVALLCVLVVAAERMGKGDNMAAHAYYPRLAEVLGLDTQEAAKLKTKFPQTEIFWRGLNEYLAAHEGYYGLPTAYALNFRYVGIPQSQALVRAADRARLPDFFGQFGLVPGTEMIPADLERLLDTWITSNPCPVTANLRRLWNGGKARERVAGVVAVELSLWDGTFRKGAGQDGSTAGNVQVTALIRQGFGSRTVELSFAARMPEPVEAHELEVISAEGNPRIGVVSAAGARLRPIPGSRLDAASLISSLIDLREPSSAQTVSRRPRRVVPMRRDELLGVLVETDRVQLADDAVLLVKDDDVLLADVLNLLGTYGHHGNVHRAQPRGDGDVALQGLPEGWVLVDDVQIYAVPQGVKKLDLHVLVPLTTAQLNFSGGLKLPGRIRKWSSLRPPEIRAAVSEADEMAITLTDIGEEGNTLLEKWSQASCAMVVPLDGLELADGDYEVALFVNGQKDPLSQTTLRLRSADSPDAVTWETCTRLNYELDQGAFAALSAVEDRGDSEVLVDGLNTLGARSEDVPQIGVANGAVWSTSKAASGVERPVVVLGAADPKSCVVTGAHFIQLPTWNGGKPKTNQIVGVCKYCGLRKALPARPRWKKPGANAPTSQMNFAELPSHSGLGIDLDSCLDALVHVGGGTVGALERVASQAEAGALFLDTFLRSLETLGHIDVRRDPRLAPVEWEANPAYLAETTRNGFVLAGVWSTQARELLRKGLADLGGTLEPESHQGELTSWYVRGVDAPQVEQVVGELDLAALVVPDAARRMLAALPRLSDVEQDLPRCGIPQYSKATIFDRNSASWVKTPGVAVPGAYRVEQAFKTVSIWVDAPGALDRTCRIGSVQLVKHLAALHTRRPLLGYLESQSMLLVPMGAELPGLYGRVAAVCSGRPPVVSTKTRTVGYRDVPREIADGLNSLLSS